MSRPDEFTLTLYPVWMYWTGRILLYTSLVLAPALVVEWANTFLPSSLQFYGKIFFNVAILPTLYVLLYFILRHFSFRSQKFVFLVSALYFSLIYVEGQRAISLGGFTHWISTIGATIYAVGFGLLAFWGNINNKRNLLAALDAEREEQINMHAEAIARARQLEKQRMVPETTHRK